jgi:hypothetical protein
MVTSSEAGFHRPHRMDKLPKTATLLLLGMVCLIGLAGVGWVVRQNTRETSPAATTVGGSAGVRDAPATVDLPSRTRAKRPHHGGNAPAASASDAVAALVGNSSLSDAEAADGLRRIVEDAGRPLPERLEALDHVLHLVPNDHPALLRELAGRRVLPDEVRMRLLSEALNRPLRLQGELLVLLLENAAGDARAEVLTQLKGLCDEDLGEDLAAWRTAVGKLPTGP